MTKLTIFLSLFFVSQLSANVYSQTRLNVDSKNKTVKEVFNAIEDQSEFRFFYNDKFMDLNRRVTFDIEEQSIYEVMNTIFDASDVTYKIMENNLIVITPNESQQDKSISGKVTDFNGLPLPGVTVIIKGTTIGTVTNADGEYALTNLPEDAVLIFSFVGMKAQEIAAGDKILLDVKMEEETIGLEEVIAVGYGVMKKSDLTGAVKRVNMEDQSAIPNVTLSQALSGLSAGINTTVGDAALAGSEPSLSVRGQTSLSASDEPLIVLDGIIYNGAISDINVNDIATVDVLKDASAAAVYGSRSANGVVIITTKTGTTEKPVISFSMNYGFQDITNTPMKMMNAEQYAVRMLDYYYQQDLYTWYAESPTSDAGKPERPDATDPETVSSYLRTEEEKANYLAGNEVDWVDAVMRVAPIQNYNLSFSGKKGSTKYFVSGGYLNEEGVLLNDQFERFTLRSNLESKVTDWFTVGVNMAYSFRDYSGVNASLSDARSASPLADNDIGSSDFATWLTGETYMPNPLGDTYDTNDNTVNNIFFIARAKVDVPFIKGLSYSFDYSNTYTITQNFTFYPSYVNDGASNNGKAVKEHSDDRSWIYNNLFTYMRTFGDHTINANFLFSQEKRFGQGSELTAEDFDNDVLGYSNMALGTIVAVDSEEWEEESISYMGRINYQYKNRYMLTGTLRRDGYSGFGANNKYANLPSVSVGWLVSEEPFLEDYNLPYLKLRLSYGVNGNQGIGRYESLSQFSNSYYTYGSTTAISVYPSSLENADLGWERTASLNFGIDYAFLDQRIMGSVDVYKAKTTDVLVERSIPAMNGYEEVWANIGSLENKGIEVEIRSQNIKTRDFQWNTGFTFSLNRDKITKLYGGENDYDEGNEWFVGEPISAQYDYVFQGGKWHGTVWTEEELYNGEIIDGWYPGQYKYVDGVNGIVNQEEADGDIDSYDRDIVGYEAPNYRFSISNTFAYKNFSLYVLLNSIQGGNGYYIMDNYNNINVESRSDNVYRKNQSAVRQYWTPDNGVTNATGIYNSPAVTSGIYEDRSFVRLQDVSLSYRFDTSVLGSWGEKIRDCQIYLTGKNLYTWTDWSGWDPETGTNNVPMMRNVTLGLKLTF